MAPPRPKSTPKSIGDPEKLFNSIATDLKHGDEAKRRSALLKLQELEASEAASEKLAEKGIGIVLSELIEFADNADKSTVVDTITEALLWKGPLAKQLLTQETAKRLWDRIQFHHDESVVHANNPPIPETDNLQIPKSKTKAKDLTKPAAPSPGLADEELCSVLRALTYGTSLTTNFVQEIFEHDFALFGTLLSHKSNTVKEMVLQLMLLLTRSADIRRCLCRNGFIKTVIGLMCVEVSEERNETEAIIINSFKLLRALAREGGVAHKELMDENFIEVALRIVSQAFPQTIDENPEPSCTCQIAALEAVLEFVKRSCPGVQQALSQGIFEVMVALLPAPSREYKKKCCSQETRAPSQPQLEKNNAAVPTANNLKGPSDTIFAALQLTDTATETEIRSKQDVAPLVQDRLCSYHLPDCSSESIGVQVVCLKILRALFGRGKSFWMPLSSPPEIPWHKMMLYFLEKVEPPKPAQEDTNSSSKTKESLSRISKKKASEPVPITIGSPAPFPIQIQIYACYCLNELAKDPMVAANLLDDPNFLLKLGELTDPEQSKPYPFDAVHPVALLVATLATQIANYPGTITSKDENENRLVDILKKISKKLVRGSSAGLLSVTKRQVARAALGISTGMFQPPVRPPLPSPPHSPPPPSLPTSQFMWHDLGQPVMTDGLTLPAM